MIVEWNAHMFSSGTDRYPFHPRATYVPGPEQRANVLALAQFDNVMTKLSGLNHFSSDAPLYLEAKPFTRLVIDAFGPERLVWGSDTPANVDAHLDRESAAARARVKGGNLARLLANLSTDDTDGTEASLL